MKSSKNLQSRINYICIFTVEGSALTTINSCTYFCQTLSLWVYLHRDKSSENHETHILHTV